VTDPLVPLARLPGRLPGLIGHAGVIALVPVDASAPWAAASAWEVARQVAGLGRRTLLVDCFVDAPRLHSAVGAPGDDGIVDAFEYGASLNRIAQRQPGTELFFVPAGTFAADPGALLANPRWPRLAAGFRHEGALLLLYVPSAALPSVAEWTDVIVVLAPEGYDAQRDEPGGLVEAEQLGKPLVVVTPGEPPPAAASAPGAGAPASAADTTPVFEAGPSLAQAPVFDFSQAVEEPPVFDIPQAEEPPVFEIAATEEEKPVFEIVEEEPPSPFELVPDEDQGADAGGRISLKLPAESVWELPPVEPPPAPAPGAAVGGYAPTAYEPPAAPAPPPPTVGGYAPTAYESSALGYAAAGFDVPPAAPPPPAEAAAREPEGEAPPAEAEATGPATRRRPPLADLQALRRPQRTRRTLFHAGTFIVSVWLIMAALRPEWVLPIGQPAEAPPPARRGGPALPTDSLPWIVQVSAWNDLPRAFEAMDTLAARGVHAFVTPLRVGRSVSYRVQAGPYATMAEAEALLDTLRAASLADPDGSAAVALPLSFVLASASGTGADRLRADVDSLRAAGVAGFLLTEPGGGLRLYAGAFEHAWQAEVLDSVLYTLHRTRRLRTRVGRMP